MYKYSIMADKKRSKVKIIIFTIVIIWFITILTILGLGLWRWQEIKWMEQTEFITQKTNLEKKSDYKKAKRKNKKPFKYNFNSKYDIDQQDLSGSREKNKKVDIGFDDPYATRDYWAYTNKNEQLTYVEADEIIIQNDILESEWMEGGNRYSPTQAAVSESENAGMQKGHVIADSLGGTSTAYNIAPEADRLNDQTGSPQRELETKILNHGLEQPNNPDFPAAENFRARLYYKDPRTNTPSKYYVSFIIEDEFWEYTFSNEKYGW